MSAAFTPGPWRIHEADEYMVCTDDADIAEVGEWWGSELEQRDANVRLIAAAPELYEALDAATSRICELCGPQSEDEQSRIVVMDARAALAKVSS